MIRKSLSLVVAVLFCFVFNACEKHPASQTVKAEGSPHEQKTTEHAQPSESGKPEFFPQKKSE